MTPDRPRDNLTELLAVVDAATPGPWQYGNPLDADQFAEVYVPKNGKQVACEIDVEDATFIATFDPPTVRALIERLQAAEAAWSSLADSRRNEASDADRLRGELRTLRDGIRALADSLESGEGWGSGEIEPADAGCAVRALLGEDTK